MIAVPKKLSPCASAVRLTVELGTVVPSKLDRPLRVSVFLKWTGNFLEMPDTVTWVSPSTLTRSVSLSRTHVLKTVKASRSRMSVNWVMLTAERVAEVVWGKLRRTKGVCGAQSSRYMTPSKGSMTAWTESSASMVLLMDMVKLLDCVCVTEMPWMLSLAPLMRCWAILGMATKILGG